MNRRHHQAEQTRHDILRSARDLMARQGSRATTVRAIADDAGVSVQTIYDSIGSKRAIVASLNDLIDVEAGVDDLTAEIGVSEDPGRLLAVAPEISTRIVDRCGDLVRIATGAASSEPELAAVLAEGRRRHRRGTEAIARRLHELGALRSGLDVDEAADTLAALTDTSFALMLHDEYRWEIDRIKAWMLDAVRRLLTGDGSRDRAASQTRRTR